VHLQTGKALNARHIRCRDNSVTVAFEGEQRSRLMRCIKGDGSDIIRHDTFKLLIEGLHNFEG